ncbi:MAG: UDP-N-acetylmuramoyl-tripeptide--D-alanyl-D-alanine ligase, partial [Chromatiales bacterium]|nr:UDP-N-acetylmuramoyl-tripeptide--D-alanyl-D-alanine ligase [Chromatiales bacterium]
AWGEGTVTRGNLNNEIGVPLTLLGLRAAHRYAVIEMGASAAGDIAYLCALARPDVALVTHAASAHLAGFGDIAGVARAKGEIFAGLSPDGVALINQDDDYAVLWRDMAGRRRVISFGITRQADVTAKNLVQGTSEDTSFGNSFELCTPVGNARVELHMPGRHNVMNALAAAAVAHAMGATLEQIVWGLRLAAGAPHRLQLRRGIHGVCLIDDTYNANPASVTAALAVLAGDGAQGRKILVLGDMAELGASARELHEGIGRRAFAAGIDSLHAVGELAGAAASAFGKGGHHYADHQALIDALRKVLSARDGGDVTVLVKGSRSMRMERVVEGLLTEASTINSDNADAGATGAAGPLASGWLRGRED